MTRQILNLCQSAYKEVRDLIPKAIESENINEEYRTADISLSEYVILTSYGDGLVIDLGAKRVFLLAEEFEKIVIY